MLKIVKLPIYQSIVGPDKSVGIATQYGLADTGSNSVAARFSATSRPAQPSSCIMGIGSLPEVKRPEREVDHPPTSSAEVKERV